jgi:hypothetical protein
MKQEARKALDEIRGDVAKGTYVHPTTNIWSCTRLTGRKG